MEFASGIASTTRVVDGEGWRDRMWDCVAAIAAKSTIGVFPVSRALLSMRESASVTTFSIPCTWRMMDVNCEM